MMGILTVLIRWDGLRFSLEMLKQKWNLSELDWAAVPYYTPDNQNMLPSRSLSTCDLNHACL
jgi:hypothetical protein